MKANTRRERKIEAIKAMEGDKSVNWQLGGGYMLYSYSQ